MNQLELQRQLVCDTRSAVLKAKSVIKAWELVIKEWKTSVNKASLKAANTSKEQEHIALVMNKWCIWY